MESSFIRFKLQANISIKLLTALNDYSFKLGKNIRGRISIETAKANFKIGNTSISRNKNVWNFVQLDMLSWTMNLMSLSGSMNLLQQSLFFPITFLLCPFLSHDNENNFTPSKVRLKCSSQFAHNKELEQRSTLMLFVEAAFQK